MLEHNHSISNTSQNVLVSIITVCYNSELTIDRTVTSILHQSYPNIEFIIIDGASTDHTLEIVKKYIPAFYGRLFIVSEPDKGIYDAMNKGLSLAKGEIVGIVNSDDWLDIKMIDEIVHAYIQNNKREGIYTGNLNFHYSKFKSQILYSNKTRFTQMKKYNLMPIRHPATYVSYSVYKRVGLFDTSFKINADKDFIYRCIEENVCFYFVDKPLSNMLNNGISNSWRGYRSGFYDEVMFAKKHDLSYLPKMRLILYYLLKESVKLLTPHCFSSFLKR